MPTMTLFAAQINGGPLGPVMGYRSTVSGEVIVMRAINLANSAIQIHDAWVRT